MEAESVSYAVCQYYDIQTGENRFGYIATWSEGKELAELKASLETINKTASGLIMEIDRHFAEVCKERGIDLSAEQEQAQQEQPATEMAEKPIPEPDTQEQQPMQDEELTQADLEQTGYLDGDMLPLSREMAKEFLAQDFTVYAMTNDGAQMIFDEEDLVSQPTDMVFAMSGEEWQESSDFRDKLDDRQTHQQEREQAFLNHEGDCFAIYQLQHTDETRDYRFEGMECLQGTWACGGA